MGWYDAFRTTKINYFLFQTPLILGPLVYFYVKSLTQPYFKFRKIDFLHFLPFLISLTIDLGMFVYDSNQNGFEFVQNGVLYGGSLGYNVSYFWGVFALLAQTVYYILSTRLFLNFRKTVLQFFSNTYKVELNWVRNFLLIYVSLFLLNQLLFTIVDEFFYKLNWTQAWWWYLAATLAVFYVGIMGFFSDVSNLNELEPVEVEVEEKADNSQLAELKEKLEIVMKSENPHMDPDLTLNDLADKVDTTSTQLSIAINSGFGKNFNDYINAYRVEEVKKALLDESNSHLSILGIAYDCGFNSKATFNRVFKKLTDLSPSQYLALQKKQVS